MRGMVLFCTLVILTATLGCTGGGEQTRVPVEDSVASAPAPTVAPATSEALFEDRCSQCHSLDRPASKRKSYDEWLSTVHKMITYGAPVTVEEAVVIAEYLAATHGK